MDGMKSHKNVSVVAATNYPWKLDSAILRRLTKRIHISLGDMKTCKQLFDLYVDLFIKTKSWGTDINLEKRCYIKSREGAKKRYTKRR